MSFVFYYIYFRFKALTIDSSIGWPSTPVTLTEEEVKRLATQPLQGTGLLEDRFIKHTTIMDTNDSVDQVPFDIAKARSHYDGKQT